MRKLGVLLVVSILLFVFVLEPLYMNSVKLVPIKWIYLKKHRQ